MADKMVVSTVGNENLYESARQVQAAGCGMGTCGPNALAAFVSERFQRGYIKLTNAAGALSIAAGSSIQLFMYGVGEDAAGAGYGASTKFTYSDTNLDAGNGLAGVNIVAAGVEFGVPVYIANSSGTLSISNGSEIDGYQTDVLGVLADQLSVTLVTCPQGTKTIHNLGSPLRAPSMRGRKDTSFPTGGGNPGVPMLFAQKVWVPEPKGNTRNFAVDITVQRALSWAARTAVTTGDLYVPIVVTLEVENLGDN